MKFKGLQNKKRGRGRPKGKKNKQTFAKPIVRINLTCSKCKHKYHKKLAIRTTSPELYTPEVKAKWICPICK